MHITHTATARGSLLRTALKLDAVVSGANGFAYLALAGPLAEPLGVGALPLRIAGALFVGYAAAVWALSTATKTHRRRVLAVIVANAVYAVDSVLLVASGLADPVALGGVWIVAQGLLVGGFAALQWAGLRRAA